MMRWATFSLCYAALFFAPTISQSQQPPSEVQSPESAYPNSSEGLQKFLHNTVEAVKIKDTAKETMMIHSLIMLDDNTWFKDEFGPAFGPRLAAAYQKSKASIEQQIQTVYEGNAQRGWSQPKIIRYADAATVDPPVDNFLNCMEQVVPLYQTAFNGDRSASYGEARPDAPGRSRMVAGDLSGYYIYARGGFRFVPMEILFLLPKERPVRVQLGMAEMQPKVSNEGVGGLGSQEKIEPLAYQHIHGKVVIHFVVGT